MGRVYVCNRWPGLRIRGMQFVGGKYVAKNEDEEKLIEANDSYGVHIWPQDGKMGEELAALTAIQDALESAEPVVRQGRRGSSRV